MYKTTIIIISTLFLLQGCAGSLTKPQKPAAVTSTPSGAAVYVNGLEVGKTPLQKNLYDEFPAGWKNSIYQAQGVLMVKMAGCKNYALKISDLILSKPIHAKLECNEVSQSEKTTPVKLPRVNTEQRLKNVEALLKKGLITKEEHKTTRERILSEL